MPFLFRGEWVYPTQAQFQPLAAPPTPLPPEGTMWYNSALKSFQGTIGGAASVVGGGTGSIGGPLIYANATKYNLPAPGSFSCVANFSSASTTLSTDATVDSPFTSSMVGWQIFATNGP